MGLSISGLDEFFVLMKRSWMMIKKTIGKDYYNQSFEFVVYFLFSFQEV